MDLQLDGKIAAVTGGSIGIGRAIAESLASEGCKVAICARDKGRLDNAAAAIQQRTGQETLSIAADLTKPEDAQAFIDGAVAHFGRLDILVNNAGAAPGGVLEGLSEADWEASLQLKFMGYVRCTRYAVPHMRSQGGGRIVNLIGNDGIKHSYWKSRPAPPTPPGRTSPCRSPPSTGARTSPSARSNRDR